MRIYCRICAKLHHGVLRNYYRVRAKLVNFVPANGMKLPHHGAEKMSSTNTRLVRFGSRGQIMEGIDTGGPALLDAILRGKIHLAKFILEAMDNSLVNYRDFKGKTPLMRACAIKVSQQIRFEISIPIWPRTSRPTSSRVRPSASSQNVALKNRPWLRT